MWLNDLHNIQSMSNINKILYFVAQSYRQIQISVEKGDEPYTYGDFNRQFNHLLVASGDEEYARELAMQLTDEAVRLHQTVDYLRQEMDFEIRASSLGDRARAALSENKGTDSQLDLYNQRLKRTANIKRTVK